MRYPTAVLLLLALNTALAPLLGFYGFDDGPSLGLDFYFPVNLGDIKALGRFELEVGIEGGNLLLEPNEWEDVVKIVYIGSDNVSISYGPIGRELPSWIFVEPGDWVLRVGRSWLVLSDGVELVSDTGYLTYRIAEGEWGVSLEPFKNLGVVYDTERGFGGFVVLGEVALGYLKGLFLKVETRNLGLSLVCSNEGMDLSVGIFEGVEYLVLDERGIEFMKKVGSVYVAGEFQKGKLELSVEYPIEF